MTGIKLAGWALQGRATCTYVPSGSGVCERPARAHALMSMAPLAAALLCDEHWHDTVIEFKPLDFHVFGSDCNLPGSHWIPSTPAGRGSCRLPHDLTEDVEAFANQPQGATV